MSTLEWCIFVGFVLLLVGWVAGNMTNKYGRPAELEQEGWSQAVIQWLERADGSAFQVLVMSRPHKPMARCVGCGQAFRQHDLRQKFCTKKCGNRVRYKRWAAKKRLKLKGESEETMPDA